MKNFLYVQLLILFCCISRVLAQDTSVASQLMADKVGFYTYTATTAPKGTFQLDTDLSYFRNRGRYIYVNSAYLPKLNLRYGISNNIELAIGTSFSYYETRFIATKNRCLFCQWQYAKDFITAGFRATLLRYHQGQGLVTVIVETHIPRTISEGVRTAFNVPVVQLVNADRITDRWGYTLNAGTGTRDGEAFFNLLNLNASAMYYLEEKNIFFLGFNHSLPLHSGRPSATHSDIGYLRLLGRQFQLQAAAGVGLSTNLSTHDFSGKIGLSWRPELF